MNKQIISRLGKHQALIDLVTYLAQQPTATNQAIADHFGKALPTVNNQLSTVYILLGYTGTNTAKRIRLITELGGKQ